MAAAQIKFDGVTIGDFLVTIGGGAVRNGNILRSSTIGAKFMSQINFDSPNRLYFCRVRVTIIKTNQWDLEGAVWNITDLMDGIGDVEVFEENTATLKRTYPDYTLDSVEWTPARSGAENRFSSDISIQFSGNTRPTP